MSYVYHSNWYVTGGGRSPQHSALKDVLEDCLDVFMEESGMSATKAIENEKFFAFLTKLHGITDVKNEASLMRSVVTFESEEAYVIFDMKYL